MNLKKTTAADPRMSRIVHGPTNLTAPKNIEVNDDNKEKFVNDWAIFSQALLWIVQNTNDYNAAGAALEALQASELLSIGVNTDGDDDE